MYALVVDEARDVSGKEKLSIVLRFAPDYEKRSSVTDQNVVSEFFLGFIHLLEFNAHTLSSKIVEFLSHLTIPLASCIALCFDGYVLKLFKKKAKMVSFIRNCRASVMSGCNAGVRVLLRKDHIPKGIYIHCSCHRLSLVINDTCKAVPYMNDYFSIMSTLYSYFTESGVTNTFFKKAQADLNLSKLFVLNFEIMGFNSVGFSMAINPFHHQKLSSGDTSITGIE